MTPFRIKKEARQWFRGIEPEVSKQHPLFDMYYFCLVTGLSKGKKSPLTDRESDELVDYYPGLYAEHRNSLNAWLIAAELRSMAIAMTERTQVHQHIRNLVDPDSPSDLNAAGVKEMNGYAAGGYDLLFDRFSEPPKSLGAFLVLFQRFISDSTS